MTGSPSSPGPLAAFKPPLPEVNRRIEELPKKPDRHTLSPEEVRAARAVEALVHIGPP